MHKPMPFPSPSPAQSTDAAVGTPALSGTPEELAIRTVQQEKTAWENSVVYVTPQVAFYLPVLLRSCLKNYFGIFDQPTDTVTGQDKLWVPLTETLVETTVKNTDLGTKDIDFRALNPEATGFTRIVRAAVRQHLNRIFFGEKLKEAIRHLAIWGTVVWSTEEIRKEVDVRMVNLLNFYIDPTSPSIREADKVTERFPMTVPEFRAAARRGGWKDWEGVSGRKNVPRYDSWLQLNNYPSDTLYVEVYRLRGMVPKSIFTGDGADGNDYVPGEIVVSWDNAAWRCHDYSMRKDNLNKGYEEAWFTRVPQRWLGRGIAEKAMPMQVYENLVVNVRKTRAQVSQLGLFKIKRGSGVTMQSMQRLAVNGAVLVNSMEDVMQFDLAEIPDSSYKDEETVWQWAQRVTQSQEITAGDPLPASTPATNAAIQNNQAQGAYGLVKENIGLWLERWIRNQALPIVMRNLGVGDTVRLTGDPGEIIELDEHIVNKLIVEEIEKATEEGKRIDPMQVEQDRTRAMMRLRKYGTERFMKLDDVLDPLDYDCEVMITNEKIDSGVLSQNLIDLLRIAPSQADQILPTLFDILGLPYSQQQAQQMSQQVQQQPPQPQQQPPPQPTQNPTAQVAQANAVPQ
jgi:hypothetical protein